MLGFARWLSELGLLRATKFVLRVHLAVRGDLKMRSDL